MDRDDIFEDDPSNRSPLALDQGTLLNDKFRVGRVLGVGGFGITYLAFDEVLEMVVAVKEYLPNDIAVRETDGDTIHPLSSDGEGQDFEYGLERFLQEARTLARFERHSNIVRVRTFFEENGTAYLVMNFYEGRTLNEYLEARNGFIPEGEALLIMEQVVDGLAAVHEENILHRDIDPNNVYLADDGTVVLLDFGAARTAVGERTQSMSVVLKRGYAPHEQYHSHGDQGPWTDVYACAATLYRAVTGYKPPEAAARILDDDLAEPTELVPSLSDATNEAIMNGLEIRPEDRPQTMKAFADLLPAAAPDAEPGWIGEPTTLEKGTDMEGTAELQVSATHECRLYIDGEQAATLPKEKRFTMGVERGTHRLRAVRTDQSSGGRATVTASEVGEQENQGDSRISLDALVWQDIVSVSEAEPTPVEIDFEDAAASTTETAASDSSGETVQEKTVQGEPTQGTTVAPEAPETDAATVAGDPVAPEASGPSDEGDPSGPTVASGDASQTETQPTDRKEQTPAHDESDRSATLPDSSLQNLAIGAGGLVVLLLIGWWGFSTDAPRPRPDRLITTSDAALVNLLANDQGAAGSGVHVASVGALPDSVGRITVADSAHARFRPASTFAGTAQVRYALANASGDTSHSHLRLEVPFNGTQQVVTSELDQPQVVHADSLGDDGDLDVVMASLGDRAVSWSQNALSDENGFQSPEALDSAVDGAVDLATADLNGNGRIDVLSASLRNDVVAWYKNLGGGEFGSSRPLSTTANGAVSVRTADFDQDGDMDVVSGALLDQAVRWYENTGDNTFAEGRIVTQGVRGLETLHIADLDRDQVPDVLVVSYQDSTIARYEPVPQSDTLNFVERPPIGTDLREPIEVHTADVTGNGRNDVIAGKAGGESIILYENRVEGSDEELTFGTGRVLGSDLQTVESIDSGDLDGDGDRDLFAASFDNDTVVWFENQGGGTFGEAQPIDTQTPNVLSLEVADVDRDGDLDVLTASQAENVVGWYENRLQGGD